MDSSVSSPDMKIIIPILSALMGLLEIGSEVMYVIAHYEKKELHKCKELEIVTVLRVKQNFENTQVGDFQTDF